MDFTVKDIAPNTLERLPPPRGTTRSHSEAKAHPLWKAARHARRPRLVAWQWRSPKSVGSRPRSDIPITLVAAAAIGRSVSTHVDSDMRLDGKVEMVLNQRNASLPQDSLEVPVYL